jgi:hypothetical protein
MHVAFQLKTKHRIYRNKVFAWWFRKQISSPWEFRRSKWGRGEKKKTVYNRQRTDYHWQLCCGFSTAQRHLQWNFCSKATSQKLLTRWGQAEIKCTLTSATRSLNFDEVSFTQNTTTQWSNMEISYAQFVITHFYYRRTDYYQNSPMHPAEFTHT